MPLIEIVKGSFSAGELSPLVRARPDVQRYAHGAEQLENWLVLTQGGVSRRPGTRYVATVKTPSSLTLVKPFEPSTTDAYILEIGAGYLRVYKNAAQVLSAGVPVEVTTPYAASDLRLLRTAQSNDVMLLVHPSYAPRKLSRTSDTDWTLATITFDPPPLYEAGAQPATAITLSALTGTITITASASVFLAADKQRQITAAVGRAVITVVTSGTVVTAKVLDAFTALTFASAAWTLTGSPVADCDPDVASPVGAEITLTLQAIQTSAPELVANGTFATGNLTSWTNHSGQTLRTGTHTGVDQSASLVDSAADFLALGVLPTHVVTNTTDDSQGLVAVVTITTVTIGAPGLLGGTDNDFDVTDAYTIKQTGTAAVSGSTALLSGGTAGVGWIEQAITTVNGTTYRVTFNVSDTQLAAQVGSTSKGNQLLAEASYAIGERSFFFTATGTTSYLQFRNNQNSTSKLGNVSCKIYSIAGWRSSEVGSYVVLHQGLVRITSVTDATKVVGEIVKDLSTKEPAAAGAWTVQTPAWSDTLGWPSAVVLYEGRLYFAGSARFPQTLWGSVIDDFFNFAVGALDDDAVEFSLVDSGGNITLNRIRWLMPAENMIIGTTHGEYRLIGSGDDPLTPRTPPRNRIQSTFGSDTVQPLKIGGAVLFAMRQGSKVREMVFDDRTTTTFVARDITVLNSHLLETASILEMAYQQEPISIVWAVRDDGTLLGLTYDLNEQVNGWFRVVTNGVVESVATIPHPTANAHQVWLTVKRTINGVVTRFVEYLDAEASMPLPTSWTDPDTGEVITGFTGLTVDAGVRYSGVATTILTGLSHLNGASVAIVGDGAMFPAQTVSGGQVTLSQAVATAFVGLPFTARGRTLPPEALLRGTSQHSQKHWIELTARVEDTVSLVVNGERLEFRKPTQPQDQGVPPFSGDKVVAPLGWDRLARITFVCDQPLPCTVVGFFGLLEVAVEQDKR